MENIMQSTITDMDFGQVQNKNLATTSATIKCGPEALEWFSTGIFSISPKDLGLTFTTSGNKPTLNIRLLETVLKYAF